MRVGQAAAGAPATRSRRHRDRGGRRRTGRRMAAGRSPRHHVPGHDVRKGRLIPVGLATSRYELPLTDTVLKGIEIRGSYLGSRADLDAVFALALQGAITPHVHAHRIEETPALLEQMRRGELAGRAVIE